MVPDANQLDDPLTRDGEPAGGTEPSCPPLPILLRVPWFPPEPDAPAVPVGETDEPRTTQPRFYPLVVQKSAPADRAPTEPRWGWRKWAGILAILVLATGMGLAVHWPFRQEPEAERGPPDSACPTEDRDCVPSAARPVRFALDIVPLDPGENP